MLQAETQRLLLRWRLAELRNQVIHTPQRQVRRNLIREYHRQLVLKRMELR